MLLGLTAITAHLIMADCPTDKPNDPSCIYVVAMDFRGPTSNAMPLCELNAKFLNPNIAQVPKRHLAARCWSPQQLMKQKTVL